MSRDRARTPVLIGAAQLSQRDVTLETARSPLDFFAQIARAAAETSGADDPTKLLGSIDAISLTNTIGWTPVNPCRLIADAIGARPSTEEVSNVGGETALAITNEAASRITRGESALAFVGGVNNMRSLALHQRAGRDTGWPEGGEGTPAIVGKAGWGDNAFERAHGLNAPINVYPLFENALRFARGQSLEAHADAMGALMAPFTETAAANPHAWFPTARSAEELVTPSPVNRMIFFPYAKYLNAVMATEQAAGALLASEEMADRLGVPEAKRVHWRGGAWSVVDPWHVSERPSFAEVPAMATCHRTALANAGLDLDEIELLDFYSCFPIAVSMACEMLGLDQGDPRGFSITGGLPYAGGPGNSYSFHSLAEACERLQAGAAGTALVTGNGWYLTKHSATVLAREPGDAAPTSAPRPECEAAWRAPAVALDPAPSGRGTVETYTIGHGRDGTPEQGIVVGRLHDSGARFLANTPPDPGLLADLEGREMIGLSGHVETLDGVGRFRPA
ncbi:MAG: acetyl-CoA acetyltransferase [Myxococcota bacterium]